MLYSPAPLHIPDGFLSLVISLIFWVITIITVGIAISKTNKSLGEKQVPLMGIMAAFIFAAQMLNFPVAGGTSGHFLGGALAAIVLGPWAGILVMTAVIAVQGLLFQDGGLLALGANVFNMAVIGVLVGWVVYTTLRRFLGERTWAMMVSGFAAAWLSVFVASLVAAVELAISGASALGVVLPAMAGVHALIGIGEGMITVGVLAFLQAARPDLLALRQPSEA